MQTVEPGPHDSTTENLRNFALTIKAKGEGAKFDVVVQAPRIVTPVQEPSVHMVAASARHLSISTPTPRVRQQSPSRRSSISRQGSVHPRMVLKDLLITDMYKILQPGSDEFTKRDNRKILAQVFLDAIQSHNGKGRFREDFATIQKAADLICKAYDAGIVLQSQFI